MRNKIYTLTLFAFMWSCSSDKSGKDDNESYQTKNSPAVDAVFEKAHQAVVNNSSVRGLPVTGWKEFATMEKMPDYDSVYYYIAYEDGINKKQNFAAYQKIYFSNGKYRTEQSIEPYRTRTQDGVKSVHIEDPSGNIIIFHEEGDHLVADRTDAILQTVSHDDFLPFYRRSSGTFLPGGTFQRCKDKNIMAFFENQMYQRLALFMEQLVGEKGKGAVILDGLYTKPGYEEPELFLITEIKMTASRSMCNK